MPIREPKFKSNQTMVQLYGCGNDLKIKVTNFKCLKTSGIEDDSLHFGVVENDEKLSNNVIRAKNKIFEYAFCNPWQYFFTGTLDAAKYNRYDLGKFHSDFTQWIRNYNRNHHTDIKYLVIPEQHLDGAWHLHGFLSGIDAAALHQFQIGDKFNRSVLEKLNKGYTVYDWLPYTKKFGWSDLEPIQSKEAISRYITKYVSKNLGACVKDVNAHMYYHSRGLNEAITIFSGRNDISMDDIGIDYENEFVKVKWLKYDSHFMQVLYENNIIDQRRYITYGQD